MAKPKTKQPVISARMEDGLMNAIIDIAKKEDLTVTQVVRRALREFCEKNGKAVRA